MAMTDFTNRRARLDGRVASHHLPLMRMIDVWRSRRALDRLDGRALDDIGVTPKRAAAEAAKPIWNVPTTWRK